VVVVDGGNGMVDKSGKGRGEVVRRDVECGSRGGSVGCKLGLG